MQHNLTYKVQGCRCLSNGKGSTPVEKPTLKVLIFAKFSTEIMRSAKVREN